MSQAQVDTVVHSALISVPRDDRRPGVDEGDERHRHHAAARRLPEVRHRAAGGAAARPRRSTASAPPTRRCSPRTWSRTARRRRATPRTPRRSRATCAGSRAAARTSRSACCGSRRRRADDRHALTRYLAHAASSPTVARLRPAAAAAARVRRHRGHATVPRCTDAPASSTWPATACVSLSQVVRRAGRVRLPVPLGLGPVAGLVRNAGAAEFVAEAGHVLQLRPGRRHHPAAHRVRLPPTLDHRRGGRRVRGRRARHRPAHQHRAARRVRGAGRAAQRPTA